VGKSTSRLILGLRAWAAEGGRGGAALNADVYGPSQPRMLVLSRTPLLSPMKTILPMRNYGVTMMSLGPDDQRAIKASSGAVRC